MTRSRPNLRKVLTYAKTTLGLERFLEEPGDGRVRPQISAKDLVWSQLGCQILLRSSFHSVERLMASGATRSLGLSRSFREDSLAYFNERLDPQGTRRALAETAKRAKRNKVFRGQLRTGLAIDGTGAGRCSSPRKVCEYCRPYTNAEGKVIGHKHEVAMIAVTGVGMPLPLDVEPYGQGDSELAAGTRLLERSMDVLGPRFADYVVCDAKYATSGFLNTATRRGLHAVVRLKENLPALHQRATVRFNGRPHDEVIDYDGIRVEIWDDDEMQPWEGLEWESVRVIRYRYASRKGEVVDAYWLTNYSKKETSSSALFRLAKSRWEIENDGFNEAKTRHGMEHICHHDANAVLVGWLLLLLSLVIERLFRLCFLHRGSHPTRSPADLRELLLLALGRGKHHDTS